MNLAALDLNLLVAFDRLLETRSVTAAARELGVTQPAMSRTLARLRSALDDPLFVRTGRTLVPTPRAQALEPKVEAAIHAARLVFESEAPFHPNTAHGIVTLAMGDETQQAFADAILARIWREAPNLDIRLRRLSLESVSESRRGEVDLALSPDLAALPASAGRVDLSEFVQKHVYDRRFVVVSSPKHPRRRFTLASYAAADHVLAGPDASGRGFVDDYLEQHGLSRRVAASVSSFASAAAIVARTTLVSTLPDDLVRTSTVKLVLAKPPLDLPALPMMLLWHPRHTTEARHRFVRERTAEAIRERLG
ncbi:MAG: LysR family transcriptional regulator [Myxococcales bacterium]|nr:LysR family transcriptional regulator [Myxococcales bacterium]MCB9581689.1 LysR family transcriptional regulator [Polyangiaceae bacterium]